MPRIRPQYAGKDPLPIVQEAGWAPGPVWTGGKSRPHRDSIPNRPSRSSVAIPTELPGPHFLLYRSLNLRLRRTRAVELPTDSSITVMLLFDPTEMRSPDSPARSVSIYLGHHLGPIQDAEMLHEIFTKLETQVSSAVLRCVFGLIGTDGTENQTDFYLLGGP